MEGISANLDLLCVWQAGQGRKTLLPLRKVPEEEEEQ